MRFLLILAVLAAGWFALKPVDAAASPDDAFFENVGQKALATGSAPGIAMAVISRARIVFERGFGYADLSARSPVNAVTRFSIGSLTKQLTAAVVALLAQQQKLSLEDPLDRYVPSLPNAKVITLRMLLDQTSGLRNYPSLQDHAWPLYGPIDTAQIIAILATDKPDFAPGARWEYSNANYAALAAVAGKAAGVPFGTLLHSSIFLPLGMNDSGFGYSAQRAGVAVGYHNGVAETPPLSLDLFSGAGGAVSSAHDLALWDLALLEGKLLPKGYLDRIFHEGVPTEQGSERYTMGWVISSLAGHRELWHNGLAPQVGGYCYNAVFPGDDLAIVILTNGSGAQGLPEQMTETIAAAYGMKVTPASPSAPTAAPGDDPAVDRLVRALWEQVGSGNLDRSKLTRDFAAELTPALLAQGRQQVASLGTLRSFTFVGKNPAAGGVTTYRYALVFASGAEHEWDVWLAPDGKIAGSQLVR